MPGPICTWERDYDVNDGTSCKMPSQIPSPMTKRSPYVWERGEAVIEAYERAGLLAPAAVLKKTGYELGELLKGLLPALLQSLIVLAATTTLGAVAGGVIGFFFGGVGAAPGAVIGGEIGLDIGTAVLSWLGLAFLAVAILQGFGELWATLSAGVKRAWAAPESPEKEYPHEIQGAANELADAVGILVLLILQGIVAWVFGKAGIRSTKGGLAAGRAVSTVGSDVAAAEAVAALVKQLRDSQLGSGFADWVEKNWPRLRDDPRLRPRTPPPENAASSGSAGAGAVEKAASTPRGRLGQPMTVRRGTNPDAVIGDREFGGHAIDQMQGRGVPASAVENTIQTGTPSPDPIPGRIRYYDPENNLTVITESNGKVVTVITGQR